MVLDSVDGESCNCEDDEEHDDDDRDGNVALDHLGGGDPVGSLWLGRVWMISSW